MFARGTLSVIVTSDDNAAVVFFGALREVRINPFEDEFADRGDIAAVWQHSTSSGHDTICTNIVFDLDEYSTL